ncbi:MAG TPA: BPSS1780 family membrane protein [Burkholderiales bacterium]|nr:BPSS1780 family membrane protein [Burkholderiales bacterium]
MSTPNPYAAPRAPVADALEAPRNFLPSGRAVPAARGWTWIVEGWDLFKRQPVTWIAIIVIAPLIFIAMAFVPFLGSLAATVLTPVFVAGIFIGGREQDEGRGLLVSYLFAGFRERFGTLLSIGFINLGITIVVTVVMFLVAGASVLPLLGGSTDPDAIAGAALTLVLAVLVMLALLLPLFMALWFAPALAVFHQQGPAEAMKASFFACLKNVVPFLLYSVILLLLAFVASIPFGLGWLVLGPVIAASLYTSYRDIFFD